MLVLLPRPGSWGGVELLNPGVLQYLENKYLLVWSTIVYKCNPVTYLVEGHSVFWILLEKTVNEVSGTWAR